jgi:hypothetical protein
MKKEKMVANDLIGILALDRVCYNDICREMATIKERRILK